MRQGASNQGKEKKPGLFGQGKPRGLAVFRKEIGAPAAGPSALDQMLAFVHDGASARYRRLSGKSTFIFLTGNKTDWTEKCDRIAFKNWHFPSSESSWISARRCGAQRQFVSMMHTAPNNLHPLSDPMTTVYSDHRTFSRSMPVYSDVSDPDRFPTASNSNSSTIQPLNSMVYIRHARASSEASPPRDGRAHEPPNHHNLPRPG
jgi:hypothetical protein